VPRIHASRTLISIITVGMWRLNVEVAGGIAYGGLPCDG
jgi:hypothetical protein